MRPPCRKYPIINTYFAKYLNNDFKAYDILLAENLYDTKDFINAKNAYKKLSNEVTRAEYNNQMNFPPFEEKTNKLREVTVSNSEPSHTTEPKSDKSNDQKISNAYFSIS